jgi:integrase
MRRLHRRMKRTPVEANRTLTALSAVFGWADRTELLPGLMNPCRYVERYAEKGERRAFTADELAALGAAMDEAEERKSVHPSALLTIRLLALTGFRRSELLGHMVKVRRGKREGLRWGDVDLEQGLVRLHDTKTGPQTRVIGRAAIDLLRGVRPEGAGANDVVCPGTVRGQPFVGIDTGRRRLWKAAELEGVQLHSLRHTFASVGVQVQGGRYSGHVSALLGHGYQSKAITERYITSNPAALRPAADAVAGEVGRLLGGGEVGARPIMDFPRPPYGS